MSRYKVEISGIRTSDLNVLTNTQMKELFIKLKEGDENAKEELIQGNLKLVLSIVQRFSSRCENMDDLFQVGCIGLVKSIDNFDLSHEVRFSTYAVPMIMGEIKRYLRDNQVIRVSRHLKDLAYKAFRLKEEYMHEHQLQIENVIHLLLHRKTAANLHLTFPQQFQTERFDFYSVH